MNTGLKVLFCFALGLVGWIFGYRIGAHVGCGMLWPGMSLCGLPGMMLTGPVGLIVGCSAGLRLAGHLTQTRPAGRNTIRAAMMLCFVVSLSFATTAFTHFTQGDADFITM